MENSGNMVLIRTNFSHNFAAADGGAIHLLSNSLLKIVNCVFIQNNSTSYGGAVCIKICGNTSMIANNFTNNFASYGGAISSFNQSIFI